MNALICEYDTLGSFCRHYGLHCPKCEGWLLRIQFIDPEKKTNYVQLGLRCSACDYKGIILHTIPKNDFHKLTARAIVDSLSYLF